MMGADAGAPPAGGGDDPAAGPPIDPTGGQGGAPSPDGQAPPGDLLDAMDPSGTPTPTGNPEDTVSRGQSDVVMDIVERTLAATGKGKTKDQQAQKFELEQQGAKQKMEQQAAGGGADPSAPPTDPGAGGAVTGQGGQGGPMGALGGALDPSAFGGAAKTAAELERRLIQG
jgi:hypothetical protein